MLYYRFGVGDFDWKEFTSRMKQKTYEEIKEYGHYFSLICFHIFVMLYMILSVYLKHVFAGIYFDLIFAGRKGDRDLMTATLLCLCILL